MRCAGNAGQEAAEEEQPDRVGEAHDEEVDRQRADRDEQDRAAAEAVGQVSQHRLGEEVHDRIDGGDEAAPWRGIRDHRLERAAVAGVCQCLGSGERGLAVEKFDHQVGQSSA